MFELLFSVELIWVSCSYLSNHRMHSKLQSSVFMLRHNKCHLNSFIYSFAFMHIDVETVQADLWGGENTSKYRGFLCFLAWIVVMLSKTEREWE